MTTTRFFSKLANASGRFFNALANNRFVTISAGILLAGAVEILDFICTQKMQTDTVDWGYYSNTPSRLVWLGCLSLVLGWNLETIARAVLTDTTELPANKISPTKVLMGCTLYYSSYQFTKLALTTPITADNAGFIIGDTILVGTLNGSILTGMSYFLQTLNYSIRPLTPAHFKYTGVGILFMLLQELLTYICDQMIDNRHLEWSSLTSPARMLAWHLITIAIQGCLYGITAFSLKKYSNDLDEPTTRLHHVLLKVIPAIAPLGIFAQLALTVPINSNNAPYIVVKSLINGVPYGLVSGASSFVLIKLIIDSQQDRTPLTSRVRLFDPPPSNVTIQLEEDDELELSENKRYALLR